jgi:penicillin-binding protein 2
MTTKGAYENRRTLHTRLTILRVAAAVTVGVLAVVFWVLQILEHARYRDIADNQHVKTISLRAPRGVLFDRNGKVLVENGYSFTISVVRELSPNPDHNVDQTLHRLADLTGIDEGRAKDEVKRHKRDALFRPIPLISNASMDQVSAVLARKLEMQEVIVQQEPTRRYPLGGLGAHLFGYVGEIQDAQLDRPDFAGLPSGSIVGQAGLERTYNATLMGQDGRKEVAVNSSGREITEMGEEDPVDGNRLQLTIDYDLQRAVEDAFKSKDFAGGAMLIDPNNGEVLAMTSQPEFDPNDFATGVDKAKWQALVNDPMRPLQDRLLQGRFSPGSTFKIVMALAALDQGIITPDFKVTCNGSINLYNHLFHCDKKEGHGTLDLRHALEQSCDVYFYQLASMMKIDTIRDYAEKLGLVGRTNIDLPSEVENIIPSTEWKMKTTGDKWYAGETISVGIGQGPVTVTPVSLAVMISEIANGGTRVTPHVVRAVDEGQGWTNVAAAPPREIFPMRPDVLEPVRDGLWLAVNGAGTGVAAKVAGHDVVGKTGTAQVVSTETAKALRGSGVNVNDNSWFVFYAPREHPTIAGVIFAEHAGWGATGAAPIARYALETYFAKQEKRALPTLTVTPEGTLVVNVAK